MKIFRALFFASLALAFASLLNSRIETIPSLGKFLSPFTGFWQNAEGQNESMGLQLTIKGLMNTAEVKFDDQRIPHIFAQNEHDLYFLQGYLTARDRLWQMEFIIRAASGRASEIFGEKAFDYDRHTRRIGIPYAAKNAVQQLDTDSIAKKVLNSYSAGVNTYIQTLTYKTLPLEYKLLDYKPELWTPYNSALLLKYMSNMLTGKDNDFEYTNALKFLDKLTFNLLFPDFPDGIDPIIPAGTEYNFSENGERGMSTDSSNAWENSLLKERQIPNTTPFDFFEPNPFNGSNNWAVAGSKSITGKPILCNDPHLQLQLPSIWYQQQLTAPGVNVYGVTIPGAPGVTIGFNEHIAWGVTNGSMDVKDWYRIEFKDSGKNEYLYDGKYLPTKKIIEEIKIRDGETFYDTLFYTQHGPVAYDEKFSRYDNDYPAALRWTAHDPSNEMKTFYLLNRAKNYDEYLAALNFYECPGQNFVFASANGDIAIKEQGKFPLRNPDEGKFVQDGTVSSTAWQSYFPFENNPQVKNPSRGFVSSANQHPTDTTYPYYYHGIYEYYRNRRINNVLASKEKFSPEDLMKLQNDNFNMLASEILPYLLTMVNPETFNENEKKAFDELTSWNFFNDKNEKGATYFTLMWENLYESLWDEFFPKEKKGLTAPDYYNTASFIINHPDHALADNQQTTGKETVKELTQKALEDAASELQHWADSTGKGLEWATYKGTRLTHYIPGMDALNVKNLQIGGNNHIVNATSRTHGASWRMVVALGEPMQAWGIYPGGQSGNPGSPFYSNFAEKWAKGEYEPLLFLKDAAEVNNRIIATQKFSP